MNIATGPVVTVYRNRFSFLAVLSGFIFFLVFVSLDKFSIIHFGWFGPVPAVGYVFLGFLIVMTAWLLWISLFLNSPVVTIDDESIFLTQDAIPTRSTTIKLSQITGVSSTLYPGIIPDYLILEMDHIDDDQRNSGVWMRIEGLQCFYNCSNLTHNSRKLRSIIEDRIGGSPAT